ncbi:MAG: flagellar assembly protein FliW [candidate division Zixibacteria bacterium]|nr:flagellar assembly protein FliW [candidate division Zixibacteria bacterium]
MLVKSQKLGELDVSEDKLIIMERPILGFENLREFCLIEIDEIMPFLWFQSVQEPSISFLVVNPIVFFPGYRIEINPKEIAELEVARVDAVETYVIVTLNKNPELITANLQGPILINTENNLAKQLILVNSDYKVRHSLLKAMEEVPEKIIRNKEFIPV